MDPKKLKELIDALTALTEELGDKTTKQAREDDSFASTSAPTLDEKKKEETDKETFMDKLKELPLLKHMFGKEKQASTPQAKTQRESREIVQKVMPVTIVGFDPKVKAWLEPHEPYIPKAKEDIPQGGMWDWLKMLLGPLLLMLASLAALAYGIFGDPKLRGLMKVIGKAGLKMAIKMIANRFKFIWKGIKATFGKLAKSFKFLLKPVWKGIKFIFKPIMAIGKNLIKLVKGFASSLVKPILGSAGKVLGKAGLKPMLKAAVKVIGKTLGAVLKFIPGIGGIIDFAFAYFRFKDGDYIGGIIDVLAGLATFIPKVGGLLSIGLSILNAWMDISTGNKPGEEGQKAKGDFLKDIGMWLVDNILQYVPGFDTIINLTRSIIAFVDGDIKGGLINLMFAIPWFGILSAILGAPSREEMLEKGEEMTGWGIVNWMLDKLSYVPGFATLINTGRAVLAFIDGDFMGGLTYLVYAIPWFATLMAVVGGPDASEAASEEGTHDFWSGLLDWIVTIVVNVFAAATWPVRKILEWVGILDPQEDPDLGDPEGMETPEPFMERMLNWCWDAFKSVLSFVFWPITQLLEWLGILDGVPGAESVDGSEMGEAEEAEKPEPVLVRIAKWAWGKAKAIFSFLASPVVWILRQVGILDAAPEDVDPGEAPMKLEAGPDDPVVDAVDRAKKGAVRKYKPIWLKIGKWARWCARKFLSQWIVDVLDSDDPAEEESTESVVTQAAAETEENSQRISSSFKKITKSLENVVPFEVEKDIENAGKNLSKHAQTLDEITMNWAKASPEASEIIKESGINMSKKAYSLKTAAKDMLSGIPNTFAQVRGALLKDSKDLQDSSKNFFDNDGVKAASAAIQNSVMGAVEQTNQELGGSVSAYKDKAKAMLDATQFDISDHKMEDIPGFMGEDGKEIKPRVISDMESDIDPQALSKKALQDFTSSDIVQKLDELHTEFRSASDHMRVLSNEVIEKKARENMDEINSEGQRLAGQKSQSTVNTGTRNVTENSNNTTTNVTNITHNSKGSIIDHRDKILERLTGRSDGRY